MFWKTPKQTQSDKPEYLSQEWILDGLKNALDGFYVVQESSFYVSPKVLNLLGLEASAPRSIDMEWWREQIHPEDRDWVLQYINDRCAGLNGQKQIEYRLRHQSGHWINLLVNSHIYNQKEGKHGYFMGTVTDVSSYRVLHDQLERTIEEGEKISQAKSHFIASLNHELRTPLNGILGMVGFLKDSPLNKEQQGFVENIAASAQLLLSLVNDILDVSKITAGKLDLEKCDFDLYAILNSTVNLLKPVATLKGLTFDLKIDEHVPKWVSGDQVRLQQIIVNLLTNAIKFTDKGSISLLVKLRNPQSRTTIDPITGTEMTLLLFKIIDTGSGIPANILPKLFQDFTQANSSIVRTHGGTGLGLSICRKLVSLMEGEIGVQSTLGKGSIFWFSVPYEVAPEHAEMTSQNIAITWDMPEQGFHILVAEDNMINQQVIQGLIKNLGGQVTLAKNGQEAIDLIASQNHAMNDSEHSLDCQFDLIFMDINMPQVDGYQAVERIRKMVQGKDIPIIACTADSITSNREEFMAKGFTDVIHKPINKGTLQDVFTRYLKNTTKNKEEIVDDLSTPQRDNTLPNALLLLDHNFIKELKNDLGNDTVSHLISLYKVDAQHIIDQLIGHIIHKEPVTESHHEPHALAHTLAGMSENIGFKAVGETARLIMVASKKDEELPHQWITDLQIHFDASLRDVEKIME